jgi:DNA-binding GntR family transcriptional regulator
MQARDSERAGFREQSDQGRVYKWLKDATINYRFRPGEQMMIGELAERLRVSSTPVRETLIRLQAEALVDAAPRRGFFAKTLNLKEMTDLSRLDCLIVTSALERPGALSAEGTSAIAPLIERDANEKKSVGPSGGDDPISDHHSDQAVKHVERMTAAIAGLWRNQEMLQVLGNAHERTRYVRLIDLETPERLQQVQRMADELSSLLHQRDVPAAVRILRSHLEGQIERMPALVKEGISRAYTSPSRVLSPVGAASARQDKSRQSSAR